MRLFRFFFLLFLLMWPTGLFAAAPVVVNEIHDLSVVGGRPFVYRIPADTFYDADEDSLEYMYYSFPFGSLDWMVSDDYSVDTLFGQPQPDDAGKQYKIYIQAIDGNSFSYPPDFAKFHISVVGTANTGFPSVSDISNHEIDMSNTNLTYIPFSLQDDATLPDDLHLSVWSSNKNIIPLEALSLLGSGMKRTLRIAHKKTAGNSIITLTVTDSDGQMTDTQFIVTTYVGIEKNKKAIIVAGGGNEDSGNSLWPYIKRCADFALNALIHQGYERNSIYYLTPETDNYPNADASLETLQYAIQTWANDADELLIYMVDHGGVGVFEINADEILTAENLDSHLDALPSDRVIVIYDACKSGSFLTRLIPRTGQERIVLASTEPGTDAHFFRDGRLSFSYQLWTTVYEGMPLNSGFDHARDMMSPHQTAVADANGNGISEEEDVLLMGNIVIGDGKMAGDENLPEIAEICEPQTLIDSTAAMLWVSGVRHIDGISEVKAFIKAPGSTSGTSGNPVTDDDLITVSLEDKGNGHYEKLYDGFFLEGKYEITVYTQNTRNVYSHPKTTSVTQTLGNTIPGDIDLNGMVNLEDEILVLKLLAGIQQTEISAASDINGDRKIGVQEAIYILRRISGLD